MDRHRTTNDPDGESSPTDTWLFVQSMLGNSIPGPSAAANRARAEGEHLEWLTQISDDHEARFRALLRQEAESRAPLRSYQRFIEDVTSQEQWDPSKHPRQGGPPNAGWFASTGGTGSAGARAGRTGLIDGPNEDDRRGPPRDMLDLAHAWWQTRQALEQARRDMKNLPGRIANERAQLGSGGRYAYIHTQNLVKAEQDLATARSLVPRLQQQYRDSGYDDVEYRSWTPGETWVGGRGIEDVGHAVANGGSPAGLKPTGVEFDVVSAALAGPAVLRLGKAVLAKALRKLPGKLGSTVDDFVATLPRKGTPSKSAANQYEIKHTGPYNYTVSGGGAKFDIDGYRGSTILEAKHVGNAKSSPYVPGSSCPDEVRDEILKGARNGLTKIRTIIDSGSTPFRSVEVITNSPGSKKLFEGLLKELRVPGTVRLEP
jgi:hypothetical protein